MQVKNWVSFISGFLLLFLIYHFPEFYQSLTLTAIFKIGFLATALILGYIQGWKGLDGFGLAFNNKWGWDLVKGLSIGLVVFTVSIFLSIGMGFEKLVSIQPVDVFFNALPLTLLMTFFPSIAEDILTRGYLLGHIKIIRPIFWVLLSATLYVLNHIWRLTDGLPVLSYLFLLGLVLGVCVIARKSLWLAFGIHWGSNIAFTLSGKGIDLKTTGDPMGPTWALAISWGLLLLVLGWWYKSDLKKSSQ